MTRYGAEFATTLGLEIRQEFEQLIPQIPYIQVCRADASGIALYITSVKRKKSKLAEANGSSRKLATEK